MEKFSQLDDIKELQDQNVADVDMTDEELAQSEKRRIKRKERKAKEDKMIQLFEETKSADPTFKERHGRLINSLVVVNVLGFGDSGNIVKDPQKDKGRNTVAANVGYKIQNIGNEPIEYQTEEWTKGEDGTWVSNPVKKVLKPGGVANLTRKYMTMLLCNPEFSFKTANGRLKRGTAKTDGDVDRELEAYYFTFSDPKKNVNDDDVKINISVKKKLPDKTDVWVVKPEYEKDFGYLNNQKEPRGTRTSTKKYDSADLAANLMRRMLIENGML